MKYADYAKIPRVNWSTLKHMVFGSPLHYLHAIQELSPDTTSRMMGRLLHALVLRPGDVASEFAIYPGDRRAGKDWEAFRLANYEKTILRQTEWETVYPQASAVLERWPVPRSTEVYLEWTDPDTGIECKGMADAIGDGILTDLKGTGPLDLAERTLWRSGYVHQLAMYRLMAGGELRAQIVAVESAAPHDVGIFEIDDVALSIAEREVRAALRRVAECRASNVWPGRYPEVSVVGAPAWAMSDELDLSNLEVDGE